MQTCHLKTCWPCLVFSWAFWFPTAGLFLIIPRVYGEMHATWQVGQELIWGFWGFFLVLFWLKFSQIMVSNRAAAISDFHDTIYAIYTLYSKYKWREVDRESVSRTGHNLCIYLLFICRQWPKWLPPCSSFLLTKHKRFWKKKTRKQL